jgi:hypothetical protein
MVEDCCFAVFCFSKKSSKDFLSVPLSPCVVLSCLVSCLAVVLPCLALPFPFSCLAWSSLIYSGSGLIWSSPVVRCMCKGVCGFRNFWCRTNALRLSLEPPSRRLKAEFSGMDVDMETSNEIEGR